MCNPSLCVPCQCRWERRLAGEAETAEEQTLRAARPPAAGSLDSQLGDVRYINA